MTEKAKPIIGITCKNNEFPYGTVLIKKGPVITGPFICGYFFMTFLVSTLSLYLTCKI